MWRSQSPEPDRAISRGHGHPVDHMAPSQCSATSVLPTAQPLPAELQVAPGSSLTDTLTRAVRIGGVVVLRPGGAVPDQAVTDGGRGPFSLPPQ